MESSQSVIKMGTLYEANQELMKHEKIMTQEEFDTAIKNTMTLFDNGSKYFMLLCHERRDYTLFNRNKQILLFNSPSSELATCIKNRGLPLSIDKLSDGNFEIWIRIQGTPYCYYLFTYDSGVIECT